jgi:ABC-type multidrug transport system fused ATPase/permease subunit
MLVRDVALQYHIQINTLTTTQVAIDFNALFGKHITAFYGRKDHIIDAMWACKPDVESANINSVRTWLGLHDSTVQSVLRYRATTTSRRDEYTCEWFQRTLLDFTRGDGEILAITGPSGCGKSFLFSWITERLQRQLGKKTHEILSVTIGMWHSYIFPL